LVKRTNYEAPHYSKIQSVPKLSGIQLQKHGIHFVYRIQVAEAEYKNSFDDELRSFKERIRKRAAEKVQEAIREAEEEERKARLGPGGLDPIEVYDSLPQVRDKCDSHYLK
jgi:hypothetical protein